MLEALDVGLQSYHLKGDNIFLGKNKSREYQSESILCSALPMHDLQKLFFNFLICVKHFDVVGSS